MKQITTVSKPGANATVAKHNYKTYVVCAKVATARNQIKQNLRVLILGGLSENAQLGVKTIPIVQLGDSEYDGPFYIRAACSQSKPSWFHSILVSFDNKMVHTLYMRHIATDAECVINMTAHQVSSVEKKSVILP
ncbi:MAG TPA: hypothetical protein VJP79_00240 [Nitrososphaera sp.]|nr:hypothetical protein [Nitrososphaera sp.]